VRCSDGPTDHQVDDDQRSNVTYLGQLGVGGRGELMAATAAVRIAVGRVAGHGRGHVGDGMDLDERMEGPGGTWRERGGREGGGRWTAVVQYRGTVDVWWPQGETPVEREDLE
jgi:hypothetical protein